MQGSGLTFHMRLVNNHDDPDVMTMGAENRPVTITYDGSPISGGVMYQTQGTLGHVVTDLNQLLAAGFSSIEDVNTGPAVTSRIRFTLTYQFYPNAMSFKQYLTLDVIDPDPTSSPSR